MDFVAKVDGCAVSAGTVYIPGGISGFKLSDYSLEIIREMFRLPRSGSAVVSIEDCGDKLVIFIMECREISRGFINDYADALKSF